MRGTIGTTANYCRTLVSPCRQNEWRSGTVPAPHGHTGNSRAATPQAAIDFGKLPAGYVPTAMAACGSGCLDWNRTAPALGAVAV